MKWRNFVLLNIWGNSTRAEPHPTRNAKIAEVDGIKRFIFWDFKRGSWQYDIVVVAILAFLFLTPRSWFKDQPRENQIEMLSANPGVYLLDPRLLSDVPETNRVEKASELLKAKYGKRPPIAKVEPVVDAEHEIIGYRALTH
jgi:hypothetical protein